MRRIIESIADFSERELFEIFAVLDSVVGGAAPDGDGFRQIRDCDRRRLLLTLFLEESTRTRVSFASAFMRMGGNCLTFDTLEKNLADGTNPESLEDSARFLSQYCDVIVARTPTTEAFRELVSGSSVSVISAGHGLVEHPTTAVNHLHTLWTRFGRLSNLTILFLAKFPKRCSHSLLLGLLRWSGQIIHIVSPSQPNQFEHWLEIAAARDSVMTWSPSYDLFCEQYDLRSVQALVLDESAKDYKDGSEPVVAVNASFLAAYDSSLFLFHLKPVLKMVSADVRSRVLADAVAESKKACLARAEILRRVL
jgi:aspartate carbamoyltransferase catalytic subunit